MEDFARGTRQESLLRTVRLRSEDVAGPHVFRLLAGTTVDQTAERVWQTDAGLRLTLTSPDNIPVEIAATAEGQQLQVMLPAGRISVTLEMEYAW